MTYRKETGDTIVQSPYILNIIVSDFSEPCRCLPESPHASFILQDDCDSSSEVEVSRARNARLERHYRFIVNVVARSPSWRTTTNRPHCGRYP